MLGRLPSHYCSDRLSLQGRLPLSLSAWTACPRRAACPLYFICFSLVPLVPQGRLPSLALPARTASPCRAACPRITKLIALCLRLLTMHPAVHAQGYPFFLFVACHYVIPMDEISPIGCLIRLHKSCGYLWVRVGVYYSHGAKWISPTQWFTLSNLKRNPHPDFNHRNSPNIN